MHYNVGKYLSELLNPLTSKEYTIKDYFDAVTRIKNIPQELFNQGYIFVSFDVVALFTNVPLQKTIDVILKKVYVEKVINTTVKKNSMRKLIKDSCKKTAFVFDNEIYEQIDGVSMGAPLAPVLPNIILTELENTMIKNLFDTGKIKFYCRYDDDTLLLMKPEDIQLVQNLFNSFHKNLRFTVDRFENEVPHLLDIKMSAQGLTIYRKNAHTGQYFHYDSFTPWNYKISWIRSLVTRAKRICSVNMLPEEINEMLLGMAFQSLFRIQ